MGAVNALKARAPCRRGDMAWSRARAKTAVMTAEKAMAPIMPR